MTLLLDLLASGPATRCARRRRALAPLALGILRARGDGAALAPAAWVALAALAALILERGGAGAILPQSLFLLGGLCLIALFDARYFVIPDGPLALLGLAGVATAAAIPPTDVIGHLAGHIAAGAAGYAGLRLVAFAYEALRGAPGVGAGDAGLFGVAGLWIGFEGLPSCLVYAVLSALLAAAIDLRRGALASAREPLPFGPHLALGLWLVWTIGPLAFG